MAEESSVRLPGVLWHVTLTLHGTPQPARRIRASLQQLLFDHGIGMSARFSNDTVELRYWDEGQDCRGVAENGLDLWDTYRASADLPAWAVIGLEVLDRPSFRRRWPAGSPRAGDFAPGLRRLT